MQCRSATEKLFKKMLNISAMPLDDTFQTLSPFNDTAINTSETVHTTRPQLPVSAVPWFQSFITIYWLPHNVPVQVWTIWWPHRRLDEGDFLVCR